MSTPSRENSRVLVVFGAIFEGVESLQMSFVVLMGSRLPSPQIDEDWRCKTHANRDRDSAQALYKDAEAVAVALAVHQYGFANVNLISYRLPLCQGASHTR